MANKNNKKPQKNEAGKSASRGTFENPTGKVMKTTTEERNKRIQMVYGMLLNGAGRIDILQFSAKTWGYSDRTTDQLIHEANELLGEVRDEEIKSMYGKQLKRLEALYFKCLSNGNQQTALNALRELNEISGLHREQKIDNNITIVFDEDDKAIF